MRPAVVRLRAVPLRPDEITYVRCRFLLSVSRSFRVIAALLLAGLVSSAFRISAGRPADAAPQNERLVIEALIGRLEGLTGARFVRNGKEYPPATAGKFLRAKWKDRTARVRTAEEFIDRIATRSSTTGQTYLVRYADGREIPTSTLLRSELQRIRGGK